MRRAFALPLICAVLGLAAVSLLRAAEAPRQFDPDIFRQDGHTFGFSFGGAPSSETPLRRPPPKAAAGATPPIADAPDPAVARAQLLDTLFARLRHSSDDVEAKGVAGAIERLWFVSGSDTADLLMHRAIIAESAKNDRVNAQLLGAIVKIAPDWAEGWNELAISAVRAHDDDDAMLDLAHALALEPRHFGAMTGLGLLLMQSGDSAGALRVFRRVIAIYPRLTPVGVWIGRLEVKVEGRAL